jgi:hypothetical protein
MNKLKRTLVYPSPFDMSVKYDINKEPKIFDFSKDKMDIDFVRDPMFEFGPTLGLALGFSMFADQPLEASFTAPYFHKTEYMNYGSVIPGNFDIGQWFRPYNFELQMWENSGELNIKKDEPLFYVEFLTDKKIILKEFVFTPLLNTYMQSCVNSTSVFGLGQSLQDRYNRFKSSRLKEKIIAEIKKNLV